MSNKFRDVFIKSVQLLSFVQKLLNQPTFAIKMENTIIEHRNHCYAFSIVDRFLFITILFVKQCAILGEKFSLIGVVLIGSTFDCNGADHLWQLLNIE